MKTLCTVSILVLATLGSTAASADSWYSGRNHDGYRGHYSSGHSYRDHRGYRSRHNLHRSHYSAWNHRYRSHRGFYPSYDYSHRSNNYVSVSFGSHAPWRRYGHSHYHRNSHDTGSFIGGLVVGGLLSSSLQRDSYPEYSRQVVRTRVISAPTVVRHTTTSSSPRVSGGSYRAPSALPRTRLLRDLQGQCFEITYAEDGTEQRSQLPDAECAF